MEGLTARTCGATCVAGWSKEACDTAVSNRLCRCRTMQRAGAAKEMYAHIFPDKSWPRSAYQAWSHAGAVSLTAKRVPTGSWSLQEPATGAARSYTLLIVINVSVNIKTSDLASPVSTSALIRGCRLVGTTGNRAKRRAISERQRGHVSVYHVEGTVISCTSWAEIQAWRNPAWAHSHCMLNIRLVSLLQSFLRTAI